MLVIFAAHSGVLVCRQALRPEYRLYNARYVVRGGQRFFIVTNTIFVEKWLIDMFSVIRTQAIAQASAPSVPGEWAAIHLHARQLCRYNVDRDDHACV